MIINNRLGLLLLVSAVALLTLSSSANAGVKASVNGNGACYAKPGQKCSDFTVAFHGSTIRGSTPGVICWLGSCRQARPNPGIRGWIYAKPAFNNVGPYRCGTPTKVTLKYKGKSYARNTKITCFAA